jgi:hypothetical protein
MTTGGWVGMRPLHPELDVGQAQGSTASDRRRRRTPTDGMRGQERMTAKSPTIVANAPGGSASAGMPHVARRK